MFLNEIETELQVSSLDFPIVDMLFLHLRQILNSLNSSKILFLRLLFAMLIKNMKMMATGKSNSLLDTMARCTVVHTMMTRRCVSVGVLVCQCVGVSVCQRGGRGSGRGCLVHCCSDQRASSSLQITPFFLFFFFSSASTPNTHAHTAHCHISLPSISPFHIISSFHVLISLFF